MINIHMAGSYRVGYGPSRAHCLTGQLLEKFNAIFADIFYLHVIA